VEQPSSAGIMTTTNPLLAPIDGAVTEPDMASPPTITEQEIGEFREQDRVLPVGVYLIGRRVAV
jgi:hypothetical protein